MQTGGQSLFSRAEANFVAGRLEEARADLLKIDIAAGNHPAVLHLLALIEKKRGALAASNVAFKRALARAPRDPQINNNYANLLQNMGDIEAALTHYGRALHAAPDYQDARYNRALLLKSLGRLSEALVDIDAAVSGAPADARMQSARGSILRGLSRLDDAAAAYDQALGLAPTRLTALHGRARVAMERGEMGAADLYQRALMQKPGDLDLVLGLAEALEAEGDPLGLTLLAHAIERSPGWIEAHEVLARMRSEAGDIDLFADHYRRSLQQRPQDALLHFSYVQVLARGGRHADALEALRMARQHNGNGEQMALLEAALISNAGDAPAALCLLDQGERCRGPQAQFTRGRIALKAGDAQQAASLLEQATNSTTDWIDAWAHLDLCWRVVGDQRHEWLSGQAGLFASYELDIGVPELARVAEVVRALHRTRAHPIGQSLRGGTQTRGRLFWRGEPEIALLQNAIGRAVEAHFRQLPPHDSKHPLLRHRNSPFTFGGSWSVRLTSEGFHINHIHPEGVLSSACYISVPPGIAESTTRDGWLEIGAPPEEFQLSLGPIDSIKPKPGRLALFPSYLFHGTRPFKHGERLTVAFDIVAR